MASYIKQLGIKQVICCLHGQLGAGKTTFTQGFARGFGIEDRLISPTFVLVRSYTNPSGGLFHHVDLYRLNGEAESRQIVQELLEADTTVVCIEWPERLGESMPLPRIDIGCSLVEDGHSFAITLVGYPELV